jgi:hypothetical protein
MGFHLMLLTFGEYFPYFRIINLGCCSIWFWYSVREWLLRSPWLPNYSLTLYSLHWRTSSNPASSLVSSTSPTSKPSLVLSPSSVTSCWPQVWVWSWWDNGSMCDYKDMANTQKNCIIFPNSNSHCLIIKVKMISIGRKKIKVRKVSIWNTVRKFWRNDRILILNISKK